MSLFNKIMIMTLLTTSLFASVSKKAMVIVPVADLVGAPIKTFGIGKTNKESYGTIALCDGANQTPQASPRMHQLLAHELVDIIAVKEGQNGDEGECCIRVPSVFFVTKMDKQKQNVFWTQTKNLISLQKLTNKKISLTKIPSSFSFKKPLKQSNNTIVLIKPFFDSITGNTFSAGTRFVIDPKATDADYYHAFVFDYTTTDFKTTLIPKDGALQANFKSPKESITCFVNILKKWAHCKDGVIFYVWGGCSFVHCCKDVPFKEVSKKLLTGVTVNVYERSNCKTKPLTGLDCAGLIFRAAQMCGIPYFFKNSYTIAQFLKPLCPSDSLHEGDIIWIPGHVMVVSDIKNNKLIEARGYSHGYGIVQEIELAQEFKGILTYKDLLTAYFSKTPLTRLNKAALEVEQIPSFKILSLSSCWR